ncbi:conserved hypothetical protein [Xanthomonas citri pv. fuscans]|nr:conserved hypothetical protein [Xanthomonas citri pv. fuscans]SOO33540.1 hypothetical protein XFF6994_2940019 [Xanthomonas citri pv. fuscans]
MQGDETTAHAATPNHNEQTNGRVPLGESPMQREWMTAMRRDMEGGENGTGRRRHAACGMRHQDSDE